MTVKRKLILSVVMVLIVVGCTGSAMAKSYSGSDVRDMIFDLNSQIDKTNALPKTVKIAGEEISIGSAFYLMAKWLESYEATGRIPATLPFLEIADPDYVAEGCLEGQVDLANIYAAARDVAAYLESSPKLPPKFTARVTIDGRTSQQELGSDELIFVLSRTVVFVYNNGRMPNYAAVRSITPPPSWIRPSFNVRGYYKAELSYKEGDFTPQNPDPLNVSELKLGLGFTCSFLSAYYPALLTSESFSDFQFSSLEDLKKFLDPDDRWNLEARLFNVAFRGTNHHNNFSMPTDPFYAFYNAFNKEGNNDFYKLTTEVFGTELQFHHIRALDTYNIAGVNRTFGDYDVNFAYGHRATGPTRDVQGISDNIIAWTRGPVPALNARMNLALMQSRAVGSDDLSRAFRLAVDNIKVGAVNLNTRYLVTEPGLVAFLPSAVYHEDFVGADRKQYYGRAATNLRLLGKNIAFSIADTFDTNYAGEAKSRRNDLKAEASTALSRTTNLQVNGNLYTRERDSLNEKSLKTTFGVKPSSQLQYNVSVEIRKAAAGEQAGGALKFAGDARRTFADGSMNIEGEYNLGHFYNRDNSVFEDKNNTWEIYSQVRKNFGRLSTVAAGLYKQGKSDPEALRGYFRADFPLIFDITGVAQVLYADYTTDALKGLYAYTGLNYGFKGTSVDVGYLFREKSRLFVEIEQEIRDLLLTFTYGVSKGLGDSESRDNTIDDGRPWEALMGSTRAGTNPTYTVTLKLMF